MAQDRQSRTCTARTACSAFLVLAACLSGGCGNTKSYIATEQLLLSDAVDASVAKLDFGPLSGKTVYLDSTYLKTQKSSMLVDSDYVISSLRQQMLGAGVLLTDQRDEAELIAEARIGALGLDGHTVTYGLPASNVLSTASSVLTSAPSVPIIPEISLARHEAKSGAAKLAVFAYERESRERVWQSGISRSASTAKDTWILGAGPLQRGTIYEGTRFAGEDLAPTTLIESRKTRQQREREFRKSESFADYSKSRLFAEPANALVPDELQISGDNQEDAEPEAKKLAGRDDETQKQR